MKRTLIRSAMLAGAVAGLFADVMSVSAQDTQNGATPLGSEPTTIYREAYSFCTGTIGRDAAVETGWWAFRSGSPIGKFSNLKVFSYGSRAIGGTVKSEPLGLSQGYTFWFRPTYGLTVFTQEFSFPASVLSDPSTVVEYEQRLSGIDVTGASNRSQLAFRIGGSWYISEESFGQSSIASWEAVSTKPSALSWGVVPAEGNVGPTIPLSFGGTLPASGTVSAFGAFVTEVTGRVRLDNYTIRTANPPGGAAQYPVLAASIAGCPASSPDRTGGPAPTPPPNPDDDDGTPDNGNQNPGDGSGPPKITFAFCPLSEQGAGKSVMLPAAIGAKLLKSIGQSTDVDRRDRALLSVLAGRKLRIGSLVNVLMGDYKPQAGTLSVKKRGSGAATTVRLRASARTAINTYLSQLELISPQAPLFPKSVPRTKEVSATSAACLKDLRTVVRARARAAKVPFNSLVKK